MPITDYVIPEAELREKAEKDDITHISTGVAVVRDGTILAVRRAADDFLGGNFELPGGGVENGESLAAAAAREVLEETGLSVSKILGMFEGFDYATPSKPKVRQMNFLVETYDQEVILSDEHDKYVWVTHETVGALRTTGPMVDCLEGALALAESLRQDS